MRKYTFFEFRRRIAQRLTNIEVMKECFPEKSYFLILALDDTLNEMKDTGEVFTTYNYLMHLREYDLPMCFTGDFIIDIVETLVGYERTMFEC